MPKMKNETYDLIKFVACLILPVSEFVGALATIWGIPYGTQIVATLVACDALAGAIIIAASKNYKEDEE